MGEFEQGRINLRGVWVLSPCATLDSVGGRVVIACVGVRCGNEKRRKRMGCVCRLGTVRERGEERE